MTKRKMVQANLIKNSISAYNAAIEIHNKPNFAYRYETVTLLLMNAWELALKAYIKKHIKNKSIFESDGHTIRFDTALAYVTEHRNNIKKKSFEAVKENLLKIEEYRNQVTHFYCDELEPYIFMLVARCALNYVDFVKKYLGKDIMNDNSLFIIPLGFKLPFKPEDFLSKKVAKYAASKEAQNFIDGIVLTTTKLNSEGVKESIVLGFNMFLESVKKQENSDIIAAIGAKDEADFTFSKIIECTVSENSKNVVRVDDDGFRKIWKYDHADLIRWCRENIDNFKQDKVFNNAKKSIEGEQNCVYKRVLDTDNPASSGKKYYSELGLKKIKDYYESNIE